MAVWEPAFTTFAWTLLAAILSAAATLYVTIRYHRRLDHQRVVAIRNTIREALPLQAPRNPDTIAQYVIAHLETLDALLLEHGRRYALRAQIGNGRILLEEALQGWRHDAEYDYRRVHDAARQLLALMPSK